MCATLLPVSPASAVVMFNDDAFAIRPLVDGWWGICCMDSGHVVDVEIDFPSLEECRLYFYTHPIYW